MTVAPPIGSGRAETSRTGHRLALLCVVVFALIGMHGLGPHGAGSHAVDATGHVQLAAVSADPTAAGTHDDGGPAPVLLHVCIAVLLGVTVAVLIALAGSRSPTLALPGHQSRTGPSAWARRPLYSLARLSVLRC